MREVPCAERTIAWDLKTSRNVAALAQLIKRRMREAPSFLLATLPIVRLKPLARLAGVIAVVSVADVFAAAAPPGHPSATAPAAPDSALAFQMRTAVWDVALAPPLEPGRGLVLEGTARDSARGALLPGLLFFIYQADARGRYGPPGPDSEKPRLAGFVRTGPRGEFRIRTILPGTYGGPPHLHFEFRDSLGGTRMTFLNLFPPLEGDYAAYWAVDAADKPALPFR